MKQGKLALGCMRVGEKSTKEMEALLEMACEVGVDCIDLADIYGGGKLKLLV